LSTTVQRQVEGSFCPFGLLLDGVVLSTVLFAPFITLIIIDAFPKVAIHASKMYYAILKPRCGRIVRSALHQSRPPTYEASPLYLM